MSSKLPAYQWVPLAIVAMGLLLDQVVPLRVLEDHLQDPPIGDICYQRAE